MDIQTLMNRDYPDYRIVGQDGISLRWFSGEWLTSRQRGLNRSVIYRGESFQEALDAFCSAEQVQANDFTTSQTESVTHGLFMG